MISCFTFLLQSFITWSIKRSREKYSMVVPVVSVSDFRDLQHS